MVIVLFELVGFWLGWVYEGVFVEVWVVEVVDGRVGVGFFRWKVVGVGDDRVCFDRVLGEDLWLGRIEKIGLGMGEEVWLKRVGRDVGGSDVE